MSTERYAPPPPQDSQVETRQLRPATPAPAPKEPESKLPSGSLVGQTLRHFRIDKRLASGGMGDVYLGYDTSLQRGVAIKTIRPELARDNAFLSRFTREAIAQANVVHPHVVQVYFVGEDRGVSFLAMQVVSGGSLHDVLSREGDQRNTLRWQEAVRHMSAVCDGLVVAEQLGIVHRDIKPANILVDGQLGSGAERALLSDFGLAASAGVVEAQTEPRPNTLSGSQLQLAQLTQVGMVMGTPEYAPPEQLSPGSAIDSRADMYALGATFFHLMTGQPPSSARTLPDAIARFTLKQRAPPLRSLSPAVPSTFADIIDRCLALDASHRFDTMRSLSDALREALPQPTVTAGPVLRALVWLVDVLPFILLAALCYERAPWLPPLAFLAAGVAGSVLLRSTPGIWLMRLRLRTIGDGDVSQKRAFARFLVQHGWFIPVTLGLTALYASSSLDLLLLVGLAWFAVLAIGALGAFGARALTLHDRITKTRVLVDTRWRTMPAPR